MVTKETIIAALPSFKGKRLLVTNLQDTNDIIKEILLTHSDYAGDYDKIYKYFDTGDIWSSSKGIFDFLKRNVPYTKESSDFQTVKSPAAILQPGETVDCKNYSLFIGGVLDAIKRNEGDSWIWKYRYASYSSDPEPAHVFVVVNYGNKEIWIDPVLTHFNQRKMPTYSIDRKPKVIAGLYQISGPNDMIGSAGAVAVDKDKAIQSFLVGVNLNLFALRDLLLSDATVLYGPVKRYFLANGYPFDTLINVLQNGKR
jgi:hypothetical protein